MDLSLLSQLRAGDGGSTYLWLTLYAVIYGNYYKNYKSIKHSKIFFFSKLLALPFLPPEHITPAFDRLQGRNENSALVPLFNYVGDTWILSPFGHLTNGLSIKRQYALTTMSRGGIKDSTASPDVASNSFICLLTLCTQRHSL